MHRAITIPGYSHERRNPSASLKRYAAETDSCLFTRPRSIRPVAGFTHGLLPHIILGDWRDLDFHATVLRFAFFGRIAGDGLSLAKAPGGNPRRLNPIHAEVIGNGLGAAFAQRLVVHVGAGAVGMAVKVDIGADRKRNRRVGKECVSTCRLRVALYH